MADKIRIGINGFGRIGRMVFPRRARARRSRGGGGERPVADRSSRLSPEIRQRARRLCRPKWRRRRGALDVGGRKVLAFEEKEPSAIRWGDAGVDLVIESTGRFLTKEAGEGHIKAGRPRRWCCRRRPTTTRRCS